MMIDQVEIDFISFSIKDSIEIKIKMQGFAIKKNVQDAQIRINADIALSVDKSTLKTSSHRIEISYVLPESLEIGTKLRNGEFWLRNWRGLTSAG